MTVKKVAAGIIEKEGKILLARRLPSDSLAGKWEFPGGKIEAGETPEECLVRELQEELGLEVVLQRFLGSFHHQDAKGSLDLLTFICSTEQEPAFLLCHSEFVWLPPQEILKMDLAPADIPVAQSFLAELS
jgi:8-oxo-dGTP diphosphatase